MDLQLYSIEELARRLAIPTSTVKTWRRHHTGPPAIKVGRHIRYRASAVEDWLDSLPDRGHVPAVVGSFVRKDVRDESATVVSGDLSDVSDGSGTPVRATPAVTRDASTHATADVHKEVDAATPTPTATHPYLEACCCNACLHERAERNTHT